jgi:oligopeptide transport system substrate-binding protein
LSGRHITVVKNPHYWGHEHVKLNGVRFFPIESQGTEEAMFRAGQVHKTNKLPPAKIPGYQRDNPDVLRIAPWSGTYYYTMNLKAPPFDDVRVRQALSMTIDRESIVKNITLAGEIPAYHFTPDGVGGYVSETNIPYDPEKARELMAEAGFPGGAGFPNVALIYNTLESHKTIAEAAQQMWKRELGIDIQLQNMEWGVYLDRVHSKDYQIARRGVVEVPFDPWLFLRIFVTDFGFNDSNYSDPEYDALVERILHTADPVERMALCQRAEAMALEALPIIPLYFYSNAYLLDPSVKGWVDNLYDRLPLREAWLEE